MEIRYTKAFLGALGALPVKKRAAVRAAIRLWRDNPSAPVLRRHDLKGEWVGHTSLSVGGDLRVHYVQLDAQTVRFVAVGTHSQLYG